MEKSWIFAVKPLSKKLYLHFLHNMYVSSLFESREKLFIWFLHPPYGVSQTTSRLREKIQTEDHSDGVTVLFLKKPIWWYQI